MNINDKYKDVSLEELRKKSDFLDKVFLNKCGLHEANLIKRLVYIFTPKPKVVTNAEGEQVIVYPTEEQLKAADTKGRALLKKLVDFGAIKYKMVQKEMIDDDGNKYYVDTDQPLCGVPYVERVLTVTPKASKDWDKVRKEQIERLKNYDHVNDRWVAPPVTPMPKIGLPLRPNQRRTSSGKVVNINSKKYKAGKKGKTKTG